MNVIAKQVDLVVVYISRPVHRGRTPVRINIERERAGIEHLDIAHERQQAGDCGRLHINQLLEQLEALRHRQRHRRTW
jgi:hypothetical protein